MQTMEIDNSFQLSDVFTKLRGQTNLKPNASIIIPVNALFDLQKVQNTLLDISNYKGPHLIEVILVINNYTVDSPPPIIEEFKSNGIKVQAVPQILSEKEINTLTQRLYGPNVKRSSKLTSARSFRIFKARILGSRLASSEILIHFDADCRIPDITSLLNWYVEKLQSGANLAYSHVDYYELPSGLATKIYLKIHHIFRWAKRTILGIPTSRGSNYALLRKPFIELFEHNNLNADNKVGPSFKKRGWKISYNRNPEFVVFTSGRDFIKNWRSLWEYGVWRINYYWKRRSLGPGS
jgi:hypothetical protein